MKQYYIQGGPRNRGREEMDQPKGTAWDNDTWTHSVSRGIVTFYPREIPIQPKTSNLCILQLSTSVAGNSPQAVKTAFSRI
eukprot:1391882-Amorphochlora_amoeboformis.AAC.1